MAIHQDLVVVAQELRLLLVVLLENMVMLVVAM
jgi:hypothetical protein